MDTESKNSSLISEGRLNLIILAKMLWGKGGLIVYITSGFIILGLIISFATPVKYTASVVFLPQSANRTDLAGMGALAGLAGINLGSVISDQTEISPDIYPNIMQSYPFIYELMHTTYDFKEEGKITLYEKYARDTIPSFNSKLIKYTLRLPWTIKGLLSHGNEQILVEDAFANQPPDLKIADPAMRDIMKRVLFDFSLEEYDNGLMKLKGTAEEPLVAAQMTQRAMVLLQSVIVNYQTQRQRENLDFIEARFLEKEREYEKAREALYNFQDVNRNRVAERIDFRFQLLSDSYSMAQSIYQNLSQQLEQSKFAVQKESTVFTVVEPVIVPVDRSAPVRTKIMICFILFGNFAGLMVALGQIFWKNRSAFL